MKMHGDVGLPVIGNATVDNRQVMEARDADVPVVVEETFLLSLGAM